jgi:cytochrome c-type biogenesis protein
MGSDVTFISAFGAGIVSFLSPCVLPLIPSYLTYITGISFADLQAEHPTHQVRMQAAIHSLLFIAGFTTIFVVLGVSVALFGRGLFAYMDMVRKVGGALIFLFGLHISGLLPIHFLLGEKRLHIHRKPAGYLGSYLVGFAFAAGWTPCVGPILGSILILAASNASVTQGALLLLTYSLGLGIPLFLSALAMHQFLVFFNRFKRYIRLFEILTGIFLMVIGVMVFFNYITLLSRYTNSLFGV